MSLHEVIEALWIERYSQLFTHQFEELSEFAERRIGDFDFVGNASEEGFVDEIPRFAVGGEDDHLVEGKFHLTAGWEIEEVVSFFEGNDPAIEELIDGHLLSAEVIDDESAAVAFDLQWRFADSGCGVDLDFELIHGEFAAGDDGRAADEDPAAVDFGCISMAGCAVSFLNFDMHAGIEDADDRGINGNGSGNPDR